MKLKLFILLTLLGLYAHCMTIRLAQNDTGIAVDGTLSAEEWKCGGSIAGLISTATGRLSGRQGVIHLAWDENFFYFATACEMSRNIRLTDGDTVSFVVTSPERKVVEGTLDSTGKGTVPSGVVQAATVTAEKYLHEVAIPWSAFGIDAPEATKPWRVSISRDWQNPPERTELAPEGMEIYFDENAPAFAFHIGKTGWQKGWLPLLKWEFTNRSEQEMRISGNAGITWVGNPIRQDEEKVISAGKTEAFELILTGGSENNERQSKAKFSIAGQSLFSRTITLGGENIKWEDPNPHIGFSIGIYPTLKLAKARIHCSKLEKLHDYQSVVYKIVDQNGKIYSSREAKLGEFGYHAQWPIPELPEGEYELLAEISKKDASRSEMKAAFEYRHYAWVDNTIGLDRVVIPPFKALALEPVQQVVSATLTGYQLGSNLLDQVMAQNVNILAAPVSLEINQEKLQFRSWSFSETAPDRIRAEATGSAGKLAVHADYEIDYDGMIWVKMQLTAQEQTQIDDMTLTIPLKDEYVRLLHSTSAQTYRNPAQFLVAGEGVIWNSLTDAPSNFRPYLWVGENYKGLSWFTESQKGWNYDPKKPVVEIIRQNGVVCLCIHMINLPTQFTDPLSYEMGFQATPVKPMLPNRARYATITVDGWCPPEAIAVSTALGSYMWGGQWFSEQSSSAAWKPFDYSFINFLKKPGLFSDEEIKQVVEAYIERHIKGKFPDGVEKTYRSHLGHAKRNAARNADRLLLYFNPRGALKEWEEFQVYQDEWRNDSFRTGNSGWYFQDPVKSYRDYILPQLQEIVRQGADGIYFDCTWDSVNEDETMGPAVEYKPWRFRYHQTFLNMRRLVKRTATMLYQEGKLLEDRPFLMLHTTNAAIIPMMSFASHSLDWELYYGADDYQNRFSEGYILTGSLGTQCGLAPQVLLDCNVDTEHIQKTAMAVTLPYELTNYWLGSKSPSPAMKRVFAILEQFGYRKDDCRRYPCFDPANPVKSKDPRIKVLTLLREKQALVAAGNTGDGGKLDLDLSGLAFSSPVVLDAETGEIIGRGVHLTGEMPYHYYRLLIIKEEAGTQEQGK